MSGVTYSEELFDRMCGEIAAGRSVRSLCKDESWTPHEDTFFTWLASKPELPEKYTRAKELAQEAKIEEIERLAEEATNESWQVSRLQIDTKKWIAGKLAPKKYGDKQTLDVNHGVQAKSDEELREELAKHAEKLGISVEALLNAQGTGGSE